MAIYSTSPFKTNTITSTAGGVSTRYDLYENSYGAVIYNHSGTNSALVFFTGSSVSVNLNLVATQCVEVMPSTLFTIIYGTASNRPGGHFLHVQAKTGGAATGVISIGQIMQAVP
jgi:hypothetical protein